jgi:hypothetical protein
MVSFPKKLVFLCPSSETFLLQLVPLHGAGRASASVQSVQPSGLPKSVLRQCSAVSQRLQAPAPLDVVGQLSEPFTDRAVAAAAQQVHHDGAQERKHGSAGSVSEAMGILTELGIAQGSLEVMQSSVSELVLASPAMPVNP